jgi:hypothetical protein
MKFVDGLVKLAEDKQRELDRERERSKQPRPRSVQKPQLPVVQQQRSGGFLENLQRIRGFVESEMQ